MSKISLILNNELEKKFRVKIAEEGGKRGDLSKTISNIIENYLSSSVIISGNNLFNILVISPEDEKILKEKLTPELIRDLNKRFYDFLSMWSSINGIKLSKKEVEEIDDNYEVTGACEVEGQELMNCARKGTFPDKCKGCELLNINTPTTFYDD